MPQSSNVAQVVADTSGENQHQTSWWNQITGGQVEKASAIAMANVDRKFQALEAQKSRDYQERLSTTAYQRSMADLQKAGLNPAMMYSKIGGSSTPSGATGGGSRATPPASNTGQLVSLIAGAVGSAVLATNKATNAIRVANNTKLEKAGQLLGKAQHY
jgi:hypothetical protein